MTDIETAVANHYGDSDLHAKILNGLKAVGVDPDSMRPDDLAPVDEFHIGGRKATEYAISKLSLTKHHHVLDIGCGIGGAARYIASSSDCSVTGIDITPDFISTAKTLTKMTGLEDRIAFQVASALDMPFEPEIFDAAITFHVAMNIPDRVALYTETARVMKPGATFCIYDVMKKSEEPLIYPVPWSETPETSYLASPDEMRDLLEDAGFTVELIEDRTEYAVEFFRQALAATKDGPSPLGIHLVIGASAPEKFKNLSDNIAAGRVAPVVMIAKRKG